MSSRDSQNATVKAVAVMQVPAQAAPVSHTDRKGHCTERFLDVSGLARYLGMNASWIYDRTGPSSSDHIPHFKMGKYIRFDIEAEEFKEWLNRNFRS